MEPIRALILDDERASRVFLAELLGAVGGVEVVGSTDEPETALDVANEGAAEVLFADVDLVGDGRDESGLTWAQRIVAARGRPELVLATAHAHHASSGFELGAVDFLIKPWTQTRVAVCVSRLHERRASRAPTATRVAARRGRDLKLLGLDEVLAFEAADRLTFVHTAEGRFDLDLTLASLLASFHDRFVRVHRQWLVALRHVSEIQPLEGTLQLRVGNELLVPVSHERAREVRSTLLEGTVGLRR